MELVTRAMAMPDNSDPAKDINKDMEPYIDGIHIGGHDILWIAFQHRGMSKGGIIVPAGFQRESGIQGIVGLIVKAGCEINSREMEQHFGTGKIPKVGDWAVIDTRYGIKVSLGGNAQEEGRHVRIVEAKMIYAVVDRPDWII